MNSSRLWFPSPSKRSPLAVTFTCKSLTRITGTLNFDSTTSKKFLNKLFTKLICEYYRIADDIQGKSVLTAISVAPSSKLSPNLSCLLSFHSLEFQRNRPNVDVVIDGVTLRSMSGDVWYSQGFVGRMQFIPHSSFSALRVNLTQFSPIKR